MKKYIKEEVLENFEKCGEAIYQATLKGDYKTNNRHGKIMLQYYKYFEKNIEFATECLDELLKSENIVVRTQAAAYCLALNENINVALDVLVQVSKENGIFGFNAKKTIEVWEKQGYLRMYVK